MVKGYCGHFGIKLDEAELEREALEWSTTRVHAPAASPGNSPGIGRAAGCETEREVAISAFPGRCAARTLCAAEPGSNLSSAV